MATPASKEPDFVIVQPERTCCDYYGRALDRAGKLRLMTMGTRRGTAGISLDRTRLNPWIGLCAYAGAKGLPQYYAEALRYRLLPWSDRWGLKHLRPGDNVLSSYGYANKCFEFARKHGGKTLLDAGNSHIENYWAIVSEEHRRWKCPYPPFTPYWYERSRRMLADGVDYILCPSSYVANSYLERGYKPEQILRNVYPVDLSLFQPATGPRPKDRPLTVINTGTVCLRKGSPYVLEAFRLVRREVPNARLLLTSVVREDVQPVLARYKDLPIEWSPNLPHAALAERLRSADVFMLLSLEEGLVRSALEAMACGLQAVLTPNTGTSDFVEPGVNGEIVPVRDAPAAAEAVLKCWSRIQEGKSHSVTDLQKRVSFDTFADTFLAQLKRTGLLKAF